VQISGLEDHRVGSSIPLTPGVVPKGMQQASPLETIVPIRAEAGFLSGGDATGPLAIVLAGRGNDMA